MIRDNCMKALTTMEFLDEINVLYNLHSMSSFKLTEERGDPIPYRGSLQGTLAEYHSIQCNAFSTKESQRHIKRDQHNCGNILYDLEFLQSLGDHRHMVLDIDEDK